MSIEIPIIEFKDITKEFLENLKHPVIMRGYSKPPRQFTSSDLDLVLANRKLELYEESGVEWKIVSSKQFLEELRNGSKHNIVDHYMEGPSFDPFFPVPEIFDQINLLPLDKRTERYRRSIVVSAGGAYTGFHVDSYGFGGWMYLIHGQKEWEIFDSIYSTPLFDIVHKQFFDPVLHPASKWSQQYEALLRTIPHWKGTAVGGDLLLFPAGFVHRVKTIEPSVGFGGSMMSRGSVVNAVHSWLFEKSLNILSKQSIDFKDVLLKIYTEHNVTEIQTALQMIDQFENAVSKTY